MIEEDIAQHAGIPGSERVVDGLAREALCHPAFGSGAVDLRQFNRQFPLTALAQEATKQRMIAKPLAGIVHARQEKALTFNFFELQLTVFTARHPHDEGIVHGAQQRAFQQEITRRGIDTVQHLVHQVIREVAGVDAGQTPR